MRTVARTVAVAVIGLSGALGLAPAAAFAACPNEAFRTGRSASLPDCRAYELVTPKDLGRTGTMTFEERRDSARPSADGEHLALSTFAVFFEPGVSVRGTTSIFSRTPSGWVMSPIATPALANSVLNVQLLSPNFSEVGFSSIDALTQQSVALGFGPVGGPYTAVESVSGTVREIVRTRLAGANGGTAAVPPLSDVVFGSLDHALLPPGPEREAAEQSRPETQLLYVFANGRLRLVNLDNEGHLLNPCGALLGLTEEPGDALNAVSDDGSKVFFMSPGPGTGEPGCPPPALYMRVNARETVEVAVPEGVPPSAPSEVRYEGASRDGSKVFFETGMALTPAATSQPGSKLYEYQTEAPVGRRLTLIASDVAADENQKSLNPKVVVADDGAAVYYEGAGVVEAAGHRVSVSGIWRYDTLTGGSPRFVAVPQEAVQSYEPDYSTPHGDFLVFPSGNGMGPGPEVVGAHGLEEEQRGANHEELYRYSSVDGSVMCVSCGEGVAPAKGVLRPPSFNLGAGEFNDRSATVISISDDGRRVFFQTTAKLVAQDTNEDSNEEELSAEKELGAGSDVYEWEQVGSEVAPGRFCRAEVGCTFLISAGEEVGPERFLGASETGSDVFFTSAAQLVPQATPEFTNIYDARVGGGFPPPPTTAECATCQGVGSPPPQFGAGPSLTFVGAGNAATLRQAALPPKPKAKPKPRRRCKRGFRPSRHGRCVRAASRRTGRHR